jgi:formimidoylglutamate deiminase
MSAIFAEKALLPTGWSEHVRVEYKNGLIASVESRAKARPGDHRVDSLLPAVPNLHSHTFQRAMAGMTERRGPTPDSFWTWREIMYRFLQHLTPDDVEAIAAYAFMEMQEAGFGSVAEFHYVHYGVGGMPYDKIDEMSQRIIAAATQTGIGLTLLPVLYTYGGLGGAALGQHQLRFFNDTDDYLALHDSAARHLRQDYRIGVAPHSLRAVSQAQLKELQAALPNQPFHIHIAEQMQEVEAVQSAYGARPVAWLLGHADVNKNWCLIHATHMTATEVTDLAATGAIAGLCPVTESNLGDGVFEAAAYVEAQGRFGVGTDSNIAISLTQELATLEYSQRLTQRKRNVLASRDGSTGLHLYQQACAGGAQALGRSCGMIASGVWADLVAIDSTSTQLMTLKTEQLLDGWIFASPRSPVTDLWSAGRHCVRGGVHTARAAIEKRYRSTMLRLAIAL